MADLEAPDLLELATEQLSPFRWAKIANSELIGRARGEKGGGAMAGVSRPLRISNLAT